MPMCFNVAMNYETPSLFDDENGNENNSPATPPRTSEQRIADLKQIIEQQKQEQKRSAAYLDERARQDKERKERAAEQGVDLTSHQEIERENARRHIAEIRKNLENINPDKPL